METQELGEKWQELKHKFVEVEGVKTHYVEAGVGKPLVLVDGWYGSWLAFENSILIFAKNRRVIAIDLWGFGDSAELPQKNSIPNYSQFLNRFFEKIGLEKKAALVGVSLGGSVVLEFAAKYPEKVSQLVIQGAPFYGRDLLFGAKPPPEWLTKKLAGKFIKPIVTNSWFILPFLRINPEKRQVSGRTLLATAKRVASSSFKAAQESLQSVLELDLRSECQKIKAPTLILEGSQTFFPPLATGKKLHKLIPNSKLIFVKGTAHEMPTQKPAEFAKVILNFLSD